jgi:hypothetical protein
MPKAIIIDAHGHVIEDADVVPPGGRISVAPLFMDHLPPEVRRAFGLSDLSLHDGMGHPAGHKPGFIFGGDRSCYLNAREQYIHELQDAWRSKRIEASSTNERSTSGDAKVDAYTEYRQRMANAWRTAR